MLWKFYLVLALVCVFVGKAESFLDSYVSNLSNSIIMYISTDYKETPRDLRWMYFKKIPYDLPKQDEY